MVREGQKRKNRGSSPKIDKSPQLAGLNNLNGSSPFMSKLNFWTKTFGIVCEGKVVLFRVSDKNAPRMRLKKYQFFFFVRMR